jgi:hypothetical protein
MAPKQRRDAVAREIAKTYTFGRSQIDKTDVDSLVKNRMVGAGRAPGRETVPRPRDNEVVIFHDMLYAGLRFPLHLAVIDILWYFDIYLHQLTPNAILRLSVYMWICRTTRSSLPPKGSLRRIKYTTSGRQSSKKRGTNLWRRTASSVVRIYRISPAW